MKWICLLATIVLLQGCSSKQFRSPEALKSDWDKAWEETVQQDTIDSYNRYLRLVRLLGDENSRTKEKGDTIAIANQKIIEKLGPIDWNSDTFDLKLTILLFAPQFLDHYIEKDLFEIAKVFSFDPLRADVSSYPFTLQVDVKAIALTGNYSSVGIIKKGAKVDVNARLWPDRSGYSVAFQQNYAINPPNQIYGHQTNDPIPFEAAYSRIGVKWYLMNSFSQMISSYGPQGRDHLLYCLVRALIHDDLKIRQYALSILREDYPSWQTEPGGQRGIRYLQALKQKTNKNALKIITAALLVSDVFGEDLHEYIKSYIYEREFENGLFAEQVLLEKIPHDWWQSQIGKETISFLRQISKPKANLQINDDDQLLPYLKAQILLLAAQEKTDQEFLIREVFKRSRYGSVIVRFLDKYSTTWRKSKIYRKGFEEVLASANNSKETWKQALETRVKIFAILRELKDPNSVSFLLQLLPDRHFNYNRSCDKFCVEGVLDTCASIGDPNALPKIRELFAGARNDFDRESIIRVLLELKDQYALQALKKMPPDTIPTIFVKSKRGGLDFKDDFYKQFKPILLEALFSMSNAVSEGWILSRSSSKAGDIYEEASDDFEVRNHIISILGDIDPEWKKSLEAQKLLAECEKRIIDLHETTLRESRSIGFIGIMYKNQPQLVPMEVNIALRQLLDNRYTDIRAIAKQARFEIGLISAIPTIDVLPQKKQ